jgi:hypothetical protein
MLIFAGSQGKWLAAPAHVALFLGTPPTTNGAKS